MILNFSQTIFVKSMNAYHFEDESCLQFMIYKNDLLIKITLAMTKT
jgi:hypothetical protein